MTWLARATFVVLVGATFAAFFVAQRLKGSPPVVRVEGISRWFSPNGDGRLDVERFTVRIKQADDVTVDVVTPAGDPVDRLADGVAVRPSAPLSLAWRGGTDSGTRAPDGRYAIKVTLRREGRSAIAPHTTMTLDTVPPRPVVTAVRPSNVIGPRGRPVTVVVRRRANRFPIRATVLRTDAGRAREVAAFEGAPGASTAVWDGRAGGAPAPPGIYLIRVAVPDRAGNVGVTPTRVEAGAVPGHPGVTVRGIAAQPPLAPVTAGRRATFFVDARGRAYRWRIRRIGQGRIRSRGTGRAGQFRLSVRVPDSPSGAYLLELRAGASTTRVPFLVQAARKSALLVVVPAITWLGEDRVDDAPGFDGVPNTLADGGPVQWPRVFAGAGGLPAAFGDVTGPLLTFLDRSRIPYDLTSDLALALGTSPRASDRPGVLLAGSERWVPPALARRLRGYVEAGGRLAEFGTDSLRRGVELDANPAQTAGRLRAPTQPTPQDPFGARLGAVRRVTSPTPLVLVDGDPAYGLLTGTTGQLGAFRAFEEVASADPGPRGSVLAALGEDPGTGTAAPRAALTAVRLGKGLVVRVGLPEWTRQLHDPAVGQVTRNIADLLRGVRPRVGTR